MKWILLVCITSGNPSTGFQSQMQVTFETLSACKAAYKSYAHLVMSDKNSPYKPGSMTGVCVPNK